jgi:hypothetical protein
MGAATAALLGLLERHSYLKQRSERSDFVLLNPITNTPPAASAQVANLLKQSLRA